MSVLSPVFSIADEVLVDSSDELVAAVRDGKEGQTIAIAAGKYHLEAPLEPKAGMTLRGAGIDKSIITHVKSWRPYVKTLPDPEMTTKGMDTYAYLVRMTDKAANITIANNDAPCPAVARRRVRLSE